MALKELQFASVPGAQQIDAFEREAATLKTLHHPRIPRYVASFTEGEGVHLRLYLAAEFIEGEPLSSRIARGPLGEAELRDVAGQVLAVLAYLHKLGVLHRDLKPDNLIVRPGGELVLVDFGSARQLSGSRTYGSTLVGTFGYMPTEQLGGTVDATSDLFALGATLLHAATGKPPADLLSSDMSLRVPRDTPMRELIAQLVQPRREKRLPSAAAALEALQRPAAIPQVRPRFAVLAALAAAITGLSFVRGPAPASTAAPARPVGTPAQQWFALAKPYCNPVEVAQFMARKPAPGGRRGLRGGMLGAGGQDRRRPRGAGPRPRSRPLARGRHRLRSRAPGGRRGRRRRGGPDHEPGDRVVAQPLHGALPRGDQRLRHGPWRPRAQAPDALPQPLQGRGRVHAQRPRRAREAAIRRFSRARSLPASGRPHPAAARRGQAFGDIRSRP